MTAILKTNLIEPQSGTTLTVGKTGQNIILGADSIKNNVLKDAGGGYKYAAFTSTGASTWTCPTGVTSAEILIVGGGGGGGGQHYAGGGGAGGVVHATGYAVTADVVYDITVGTGSSGGSNGNAGTAGADSVWNVNAEGSGITMTGNGGGGGGSNDPADPTVGGSGGGGGAYGSSSGAAAASDQPNFSGATSYGNSGGAGSTSGGDGGGGGGGANAAGGVNAAFGGAGGAGKLFSNFTSYGDSAGGYPGYFGGGGNGGTANAGGTTRPAGAAGGGGQGAGSGGTPGGGPTVGSTGGTANTGGGGGGSASSTGSSGGSGVVLIRYQDPTPNAIWTSNGSGVLSGVNAGFGSPQVLIQTQVASDSASIDFTTGIDSTYKEYVFQFITILPESDNYDFAFQCNVSGQSGFNEIMSTTVVAVYNNEASTDPYLYYNANADQSEGTAFQSIARSRGNNASDNTSGELHLFNPASTTYVKNWYVTTTGNRTNDYAWTNFTSGYFETTSAIDEVSFKMKTDNIAAGTIKMYGIK